MNIAIKVIRNTAKQFVSELQKESKKASRKAIGKCGLLLRNQARRNLKSSSIHITDSRTDKDGNKLFNDKLLQGVRVGRVYRQENSFKRNVRITLNRRNKKSGWYRLSFINYGTNQRFQKKRNNKNVGRLTATHFYNNALASFNFKEKYDDEMNKQLSKMKK